MIWFILISLLLLFFLWLLLVPVILYTDTDRNRYFLSLPGIVKAVVVPDAGLFYIRGWILFFPYRFHPFKPRKRQGKPRKPKEKKRKKRFTNPRIIRGALRAFRIRRVEANIDTDDFTWNAWLVPVFSVLNGKNIHLQVNFEGHQSLLLDLRVTLGTLIWNMIKAKYKPVTNH
jgi:hypothetical protein